jgi:hypothetical protein
MAKASSNLALRLSQAAALAGLAGAGLAVTLVGRTRPPEPPAVVELPAFTPLDDAQAGAQQAQSTPGTASRFAFIANKPKPAAAAVVQPAAGPPPPPPPPPPPSVTYHGIVSAGEKPLALLRDGGKQVFVRVGDIVQGKRVQLIEPARVRLVATTGDAEAGAMEIALSERSGGSVTLSTAPAPVAQQPEPSATESGDAVRERLSQLAGKADFRRLLDPRSRMVLTPDFVPPEDAPLYLFVWERFARSPDGSYEPGQLEKLVYEQVKGNRQEFEDLARKQLGDRYDELVKTVAQRQSEMRQEFDGQGLSTNDPDALMKFNQERLRKEQP